MSQRFVAHQILRLLSSDRGSLPGMTLGDIEIALFLSPGTATHQRISDLRTYGWDIRTDPETHRHYYMLARERRRAKAFLAKFKTLRDGLRAQRREQKAVAA